MPRPLIGAALAAGMVLYAQPSCAQVFEHSKLQLPEVSARRIFLLLFLMLGPLKILTPFATMTRGSDWRSRWNLACRSVLFSFAIIAFALAVGGTMLDRLEVSVPALALVGSVVLILVASRTILQQPGNTPPAVPPAAPIYALALTPLAFPIIVTPFGIAALIVLRQLAAIQGVETALYLIVAVILLLDLLAMVFAEFIVKWASVPLYIFAVVLALIQAALGLQIALRSLAVLNLLPREVL